MRIRMPKNLGIILLAIYLILVGIAPYVNLGQLGQLVPFIALIAGIVLLISR